MGTKIADLAVILSANTSKFVSGLNGALKTATTFGSGLTSMAAKVTGLAGVIAGGAGVAGLVAFTKGNMDAIDANAKLSDRLGISTEALTGLQHAASLSGVSSEGLTGALEKMLKSMSEATQGSAAQAGAFQALGLSAQELANMSPDQAFSKIADGLAGVQNPATRAALAMEIFGKSGQSLLPLMMSGAEGIKAAREEAAKLGLTYSRLDAAKVEAANDAMEKMQGVIRGAGQTLAIQLAPFITAAADKLTALASSGEGMGARVVNAFEWVLTAIAKAADYLELLRAGFYAVKGVVALAFSGVVQAIGLAIQAVEWLAEKLGATNSHFGEFARSVGKEMIGEAVTAFDKAGQSWNAFAAGSNAKAVTQLFADIRTKADESAKAIADNAGKLNGARAATEDWGKAFEDAKKKADDVNKTIEGLQTDLATFGMNDGQKKLFDLKALGASPEQLEQAKRLIDQLDAKKAAQDLGKAMDQIKEDLATAGLSDVDKKLFDLSKLGATPEQLDQARQMLEQIDTANQKTQTQAPKLMLSGSAEAQKLAYEASIGVKSTKDEVAKKQLKEQETSNNWFEKIERNTRSGGLVAYA